MDLFINSPSCRDILQTAAKPHLGLPSAGNTEDTVCQQQNSRKSSTWPLFQARWIRQQLAVCSASPPRVSLTQVSEAAVRQGALPATTSGGPHPLPLTKVQFQTKVYFAQTFCIKASKPDVESTQVTNKGRNWARLKIMFSTKIFYDLFIQK